MAHGTFTFKLRALHFDVNALNLIFNFQVGKNKNQN